MKFDYISYWSAIPYIGFSELKERLPLNVQKGLLQGEKFEQGIYIESSDTDIIKEIDKAFKIGKKKEVTKHRHLEIDKAEIPNYTHFQIDPKGLEHGKELLFDLTSPSCRSDACSWESSINSPIVIKEKSLENLGIAQIHRLWSDRLELIISSKVKKYFDSENVTGLEYEPCIDEGKETSAISREADAYLATIISETYQLADDIILKTFCKKHNVILNYDVFNMRTPKRAILDSDFQVIKNLRVGRKTYIYYRGRSIISRKVLDLLLKHKVPGLKPYGYVLNQKFLPFIIQ